MGQLFIQIGNPAFQCMVGIGQLAGQAIKRVKGLFQSLWVIRGLLAHNTSDCNSSFDNKSNIYGARSVPG